MPRYDFHCSECDSQFEQESTIANRDLLLENPCPNCGKSGNLTRLVGAPPTLDPVMLGIKQPSATFQNRLREIASSHSQKVKGHYGNNITEI